MDGASGVLRIVWLVGATVSFAEGHEFLRDLAGVEVPTKHVERAAEALGREIGSKQRADGPDQVRDSALELLRLSRKNCVVSWLRLDRC